MKKLSLKVIFSVLFMSLFIVSVTKAQNIYVDSSATGANNGSSWADAYTSLKVALDYANLNTVDSVFVAKGTYYATTGTARDSSFNIKHDMVVMGGYPSGGGTRNWTANPTILSGDIGVQGDSTDNTYNVVHNTGMDTLGVIDGFTIEYGNATASTYPNNQGGGMLNENCSPKIQNVTFYRNTASFGGGMNCGNSYDAVLSNISFIDNTGIYDAGALSCTSSNLLRADHLTFTGNRAYTAGAVELSYCTSPTFTNVTFKNNTASLYQGGALFNSHASPIMSNVTFIQDTAGTDGGAIFNTSSSAPVITNAVFSGNSAVSGGAVYNSYCMLNISNSVFYQNYATDNGGAIYTVKGTDKLVNNTFEGNYITSTSADGGAVRLDSATETMNMSNCIFWANKFGTDSVSAGSDISVGGGTLHAVYNSFQTSVSGTGNMIGNPLFVNENNAIGTDNMWMTADDGLHLQCASSAINAGINDSVPVGLTTDISGMNRIMDSTVDMGAYENHGPTHSTMAVTTCSSYTSPSGHYTWTASGTYLDTIPNAAGCDSLMTIHLTIGAVDTSVTANADSLYANAGNATYQWLDCNNNDNPIAGATGQSYMPTANGSYAVIVTQGTCVDTSSCVNYTMTGINNITTNNYLKIYPNPSIGSITISSDLTGTYYLVNELGQQIEVIKLTNANNKTVNVSRLSNGIYTLVGYHGNRRISKRIVVTR